MLIDGVFGGGIDAGVAAVFRGVGIEEELVGFLAERMRGVSEVGFCRREVDDENQVRTLGDEDLVFVIHVEELGGRGLEEFALLGEVDEIAVPLGEPLVFQVRII